MRSNKLTFLFSLLVPVFILLSSCRPEELISPQTTYSKRSIMMTGAQEVPAVPTTGFGLMNVSYSKVTKVLSYDFTWSDLTGPVTVAHVHGLAPIGYTAGFIQLFTGIAASATGKYSGTLLVDGVRVKEEDLLNGLYYINLHTSTYPGGEIRGQIHFN